MGVGNFQMVSLALVVNYRDLLVPGALEVNVRYLLRDFLPFFQLVRGRVRTKGFRRDDNSLQVGIRAIAVRFRDHVRVAFFLRPGHFRGRVIMFATLLQDGQVLFLRGDFVSKRTKDSLRHAT